MELARYVLRSKLAAFDARISLTAIKVKLISRIVAAHLHDAAHKHRVKQLYTTDTHRLMSSIRVLNWLKQSHLAALVSLCGSSPSSDSAMLLLRHFTGADHSILIR